MSKECKPESLQTRRPRPGRLLALWFAAALGLCVTLLAHAQTPAAAVRDSRLQDRVFQSESLGRSMHYRILLPADYFQSVKHYPVLILLHGWHGDYKNWTTLTNLDAYAERLPIIIVMADAGDSWYVNSASSPQDKFERYIVRDLVDEVDQTWRTLRNPHRRAVAGLSMGGYGALKFAFKYPEMFAFAGSISGAFNAPTTDLANTRSDLRPSLQQAFGATDSGARLENDVYVLADRAPSSSIPYLYLDCGTRDATFLLPNRTIMAKLSDRGLVYEYHEYPGVHNWQYWDERLPDLLHAVVRHIAPDLAH